MGVRRGEGGRWAGIVIQRRGECIQNDALRVTPFEKQLAPKQKRPTVVRQSIMAL